MDGDADRLPETAGPAAVPPPASPPADATPAPPAAPAVPALTRWQRRERAAADALRTFLRDLHEAHHGAVAPNTPEVTIELRLRLQPGAQWALAFEPALEDQVLPQLVHLHSLIGVYCEGRVYCYKCDSTACVHAAPPTPLSVFDGFDPMGLPEWKDFAQALVDARDERVAAIAAAASKEVAYHVERSTDWVIRLGDGTDESHRRMQSAIDGLWMYAGELFAPDAIDEAAREAGVGPDLAALAAPWRASVASALAEATLAVPADDWAQRGGRQGRHTEHLGHLLTEMQFLQRAYPDAKW